MKIRKTQQFLCHAMAQELDGDHNIHLFCLLRVPDFRAYRCGNWESGVGVL